MSHESTPETPEQTEWLNSLEVDILDRHAHKRTKEAIARAEKIKMGQWLPDIQTVEVVLQIANSWLDRLAPHLGKDYHYQIRYVGDTYQVYQKVDNDNPDTPESNIDNGMENV